MFKETKGAPLTNHTDPIVHCKSNLPTDPRGTEVACVEYDDREAKTITIVIDKNIYGPAYGGSPPMSVDRAVGSIVCSDGCNHAI